MALLVDNIIAIIVGLLIYMVKILHCIVHWCFRFTVKVGEWLTTSDIDCGEEFCALPSKDIPISHVIVHPNYQKETYRNNIALLVLRDSFNYTGKT